MFLERLGIVLEPISKILRRLALIYQRLNSSLSTQLILGRSSRCRHLIIRLYNKLAGQTSVGLSFEQPAQALDSTSTSSLNSIEALKALMLNNTVYFNASSSECFGNTGVTPASEDTPFKLNSLYAVAKASAFHITRLAREAYGIHAFSGILSNHKSPLRGERFVTTKIIEQLRLIQNGSELQLILGNLKTARDW